MSKWQFDALGKRRELPRNIVHGWTGKIWGFTGADTPRIYIVYQVCLMPDLRLTNISWILAMPEHLLLSPVFTSLDSLYDEMSASRQAPTPAQFSKPHSRPNMGSLTRCQAEWRTSCACTCRRTPCGTSSPSSMPRYPSDLQQQ